MALIPIDEALTRLTANVLPVADVETVAAREALGRVLAEDQVSPLNVPPADNSAMDGYALRFADVQAGQIEFRVSQRVPAGHEPNVLEPGTAARVFTGAEIPSGADTVVMQEGCAARGKQVVLREPPSRIGEHVRRAGQDVEAGSLVVAAGTRLSPAHLGLLTSVGIAALTVRRKLRVAVVSTGDELVPPGEPLAPGQIYASNQYQLNGLLESVGYQAVDRGIVPDDPVLTRETLAKAAEDVDCVIAMGGVSVGEEDHVRQAVASLGAIDLWKVNIKPGKPFAFGRIGRTPFVGLPGNPVSVFVTYLVLVRPYLALLQGENYQGTWRLRVAADFDWTKPGSREEFLRGRLDPQTGAVEIYPNQSSGVLSSVAWANCLVEVPPRTTIARGDTVTIFPYA